MGKKRQISALLIYCKLQKRPHEKVIFYRATIYGDYRHEQL